jgi:hypothetical protein
LFSQRSGDRSKGSAGNALDRILDGTTQLSLEALSRQVRQKDWCHAARASSRAFLQFSMVRGRDQPKDDYVACLREAT